MRQGYLKAARKDANGVSLQQAPSRKISEEREKETKSLQKALLTKAKSKTKSAPPIARIKGKGKGGNMASFFGNDFFCLSSVVRLDGLPSQIYVCGFPGDCGS